jgi:hypothetical protein
LRPLSPAHRLPRSLDQRAAVAIICIKARQCRCEFAPQLASSYVSPSAGTPASRTSAKAHAAQFPSKNGANSILLNRLLVRSAFRNVSLCETSWFDAGFISSHRLSLESVVCSWGCSRSSSDSFFRSVKRRSRVDSSVEGGLPLHRLPASARSTTVLGRKSLAPTRNSD